MTAEASFKGAWSLLQSGIGSLDWQHWFWATIAGLVAIALNSVMNFTALRLFNQAAPEPPAVGHGRIFSIWTAVNAFMFGALATFFWLRLRGARRTERALADAQLVAAEASRNVVTSRLQAAQAHVDPQLLFDVLDRAEALYESDRMAATVLIDDLIAYLRAAMPRMRDTSSTLAQEIDLARAYLAIVKVRVGDRLSYTIDVPVGIAEARLPPMTLLPLIEHAVVHGLELAQETGTLRVITEALDGRLRLTVVDSGAGFVRQPAADGITSIRERLAALYGTDKPRPARARPRRHRGSGGNSLRAARRGALILSSRNDSPAPFDEMPAMSSFSMPSQ